MSTYARSAPVKRVIKNKSRFTIPARSTTPISVMFSGSLPDDRDLLFEPDCQLNLGHAGGVFAHVVDASLNKVLVRNRYRRAQKSAARDRGGVQPRWLSYSRTATTPTLLPLAGKTHGRASWQRVAAMTAAASLPRAPTPQSSTRTAIDPD